MQDLALSVVIIRFLLMEYYTPSAYILYTIY